MHGSSGEHSFLRFYRGLTPPLSRLRHGLPLSRGQCTPVFASFASSVPTGRWICSDSGYHFVFFLYLLPPVLPLLYPPRRLFLPNETFLLLPLSASLLPSLAGRSARVQGLLLSPFFDRPISNPPSRTMKPKIFSGTRGMRCMITYIE